MTSTKQRGFILRPPTLDDVQATVDMLNASSLDTLGTLSHSVDFMRQQWERPDSTHEKNIRLAVDDGQVVGYCSVGSSAPYVQNFLTPRTHPAQRGRGIGTALTRWGEKRAAENLPLASPNARVTAVCINFSTNPAGAQVILDLGYHHIRSYFEMKIELESAPPPPVLPAGITVRGMIADQEEAAVYRAQQEVTRDHWGTVEKSFEEDFPKWLKGVRSTPDYDPDFFFLAFDGDQIAGLALCFPKDNDFPDMCWVDGLGVLRPWRRRGLALALLHHVFGECYRRGIRKVGLGVDADSLTGATRLYEKAGMHAFRQWDNYEPIREIL